MAKKYIPEGSWLACDKGTCPSSFRISHNNNTNIYGSKLASEADLLPFFNIKPMGICTVLFGSCMPAVLKWDDPQDGVSVNGHRLLKEDSTCQCVVGGKIKIYFDRASAAAACVAGEIKMPTEYIKEGFDWAAEQTAKSREERDSHLPGWMQSVAHVSDWGQDVSTGLVEGAVNGVVGMGEGIYQIAQDPVGTAEAIGGMVSSGYNSAKEGLTNAYKWSSHSDNWSNAYNSTTDWVSHSDNWKAAASSAWESTKEAGSWVANNPRTIGTSVGQFVPDVVAAVYTGGTSEAASAARIAAKEAEEAAARQLEKQAAERLAKEEAARLAAKELARGADDVVGEVVVKSEKELAEEAITGWSKGQIPCFPVGTLVSTTRGLVKIENIKTGETIYGYDFLSKFLVEKRVIDCYRGTTNTWVDIFTKESILRATKNHPIWIVSENKWIASEKVVPGMTLLLRGEKIIQVEKVDVILLEHPENTYNLSVEEVNNYFAGIEQILVHNDDKTRLDRPGYKNYSLRDKDGKIYYEGMYGPNETEASVKARHGANNNRFDAKNGDRMVTEPGNRTYGDARRMEHERCVRNKTYIGNDGANYRGNRQYPLGERNFGKYYKPDAC